MATPQKATTGKAAVNEPWGLEGEEDAGRDVCSPENMKRIIQELPHVCEGRVTVSEQLVGVFVKAEHNFKARVTESLRLRAKPTNSQLDILSANSRAAHVQPEVSESVRANFFKVRDHRALIAQAIL